jgi:RNA polymerase sigma-70 factor, ECF subfamily
MWKRASHYDGERGSAFTWAAMISRNKAIDRLRALGRRSRAMKAAETELSNSPTEEPSQAEALRQGEEHARIRAGLAQLPEAQREAIHLAFFGGLTHIEISSKTGVPLGTVKARIRRGLLALRSVWKL